MDWNARQRDFFNRVWPEAQRASSATGVPAETIFAQAALETGWGRSAPNNNYFGIKGNGSAQTTREFIDGRWVTITDNFRGYRSLADSVTGYIEFITNPNSRRWGAARQASTPEDAARALQQGGYATDPDYATKLINIIRGIPNELRNQTTQQANRNPIFTPPFTAVENPLTGPLRLPDLPSVSDILNNAREAATGAVDQAREVVSNNPVTQSLDFFRNLFSQETGLRVLLVVIGLILLALAVASLVTQTNSVNIAKEVLK